MSSIIVNTEAPSNKPRNPPTCKKSPNLQGIEQE